MKAPPVHTLSCALCGRTMELTVLLAHLEHVHGVDVELETWPDGLPVVLDCTLEPEDFAA